MKKKYLYRGLLLTVLSVFCLKLFADSNSAAEAQKKTNIITVAVDKSHKNNADYYGLSGLQEAVRSLDNSSADDPCEIRLFGMFHAKAEDFKTSGVNRDKTLIPYKKDLIISGNDKEKDGIIAVLPDDLDIPYQDYNILSAKGSMTLKNLRLVAGNIRYVLHIYGGTARNSSFLIDTCKLIHKGSTGKSLKKWPHPRPLGVGMSSGMKFTVKNSYIYSDLKVPLIHGSNCRFSSPAHFIYENVKVETGPKVNNLLYLYSQGSRQINTVELKNVSGKGDLVIGEMAWTLGNLEEQLANHNEFKVIMHDMNPRAYSFYTRGAALKISSKSKGEKSTVRFDENSSAFPLILGNDGNNQYTYRDGGNTLSGYAMGLCSIQENPFKHHKGKYLTALGKRLGDCSTQSKTLGVVIDGKRYEIVFDKNYDGTDIYHRPKYSNAQIIAEINKVIGNAATVSTFDPGSEYYPEFHGLKKMINRDKTDVRAGMGIVFTKDNGFRKALNSDGKIDGISLDNGRVGDTCRIITSGELWAKVSRRRFAVNEQDAKTRKPGALLGISKDTPGAFAAGIKPALLKAERRNVLKIILNP